MTSERTKGTKSETRKWEKKTNEDRRLLRIQLNHILNSDKEVIAASG